MSGRGLLVIQHVEFEGPGRILEWTGIRKVPFTIFRTFDGKAFPKLDDFELVVILGGPMTVYERAGYSWMDTEIAFLSHAVEAGKAILGICLGAQIMAHLLGAHVGALPTPEIGWFPVTMSPEGKAHPIFAGFPVNFTALHWHGDTFSIPRGAVHVASSAACRNQAFVFGDRVVGLQFHLEATEQSLQTLVDNSYNPRVSGRFVMSKEQTVSGIRTDSTDRGLLFALLDSLRKIEALPAGRADT
ncbi:MAG TPA: type 1 glutamine amidotransferase [Spirochaetia bacterium]|nr:type 1 glutamine amidotransferase [Spirochaetia bacterium]